jgi:hypothetical protein
VITSSRSNSFTTAPQHRNHLPTPNSTNQVTNINLISINMSTGKLDQSLDDILQTRRQSTRRGRGNRRSGAGRPAATDAPVGGVHKSTKQTKQAKVTPTAPAAASGNSESKIMISNLVRRPTTLLQLWAQLTSFAAPRH